MHVVSIPGTAPKETTMLKKELSLLGNDIDLGVILSQRPEIRDFIVGVYLKVSRSKMTLGDVERAYKMRGHARELWGEDLLMAMSFIMRQPKGGAFSLRFKADDIEKFVEVGRLTKKALHAAAMNIACFGLGDIDEESPLLDSVRASELTIKTQPRTLLMGEPRTRPFER